VQGPAAEPSPPASPRAAVLRSPRVLSVIAVALGLVVAQRLGLCKIFADPAQAKQALVGLGPWGYVAFVAAYAALQPFGVPGTVFVFAAPLIWPWPVAFALSMVGTMAASVVGFSFARFVARDWVAPRVPARFQAYNEALERRGFATVATLRFVFWMPQVLHTFLGLSRVPFWTHFWGSVVGYFLPLLGVSYFGEKMFDLARNASPSQWAAAVAVTALVGLVVWRVRR